jgi:hypothetical protein
VTGDVPLAVLTNTFTNLAELVRASWDAIWSGKDFWPDFTGLLDGFKATKEKPPEIARPVWVDLQKERDAILERVGAKEAARAAKKGKAAAKIATGQEPAAPARKGAAGGAPEAVGKESKQKAEFVGLAEFAKKIQEGIFSKDSGKETAKWTELTAQGVQRLVEKRGKWRPELGFAV